MVFTHKRVNKKHLCLSAFICGKNVFNSYVCCWQFVLLHVYCWVTLALTQPTKTYAWKPFY